MIYFASDFHLGIPNHAKSIEREKKIIRWLESIEKDAEEVFLMGDLFDFWFEYKYVVPKGFVRILGKLAAMVDSGIKITAFKGNHDMWMFGYFEKELGIPVISDDLTIERSGKTFYLHHGDGLGPGDNGYKLIRAFFRNPICIWLFALLPPRWGMGLANYFSSRSRLANQEIDELFNEETEWLLQFSNNYVLNNKVDYLIFGHRHLPLDLELENGGRYINLGEWLHHCTYAVFDGKSVTLKHFESNDKVASN